MKNQYTELYDECRGMICSHSAEVMNAVRDEAYENFKRQGFPTTPEARSKYTFIANGVHHLSTMTANHPTTFVV